MKEFVSENENILGVPDVDAETLVRNDLDSQFVSVIDSLNSVKYDDSDYGLNLKGHISEKEYLSAFVETFRLLGALFSKKEKESGLNKYAALAKKIDFSVMDDSKIKEHIKFLQKYADEVSGLQRKLYICKLLSDAKDQTEVNKNYDKYQKLAKDLKYGDVVLLNKLADLGSGSNLLRDYDENNPIDFTHVILITGNNNGVVKFIHSTMHKESEEGAGVEQFLLKKYFDNHLPIDFLVLEQSDEMKEKTVEFAYSQLGKGYDYKIAMASGLGVDTIFGENVYENELFNCVQLIVQAYFEHEIIKKIGHPNDFLEFGIFKMKYMGSVL